MPIVANVEEKDSIDILELSGCNHVVPLHRRLGERLAARVNAGQAQTHLIGNIRATQNRRSRGPQHAVGRPRHRRAQAGGNHRRAHHCRVEARALSAGFAGHRPVTRRRRGGCRDGGSNDGARPTVGHLCNQLSSYHPALVIGGGKVGQSTVQALKQKDIPVHLLERDESIRASVSCASF